MLVLTDPINNGCSVPPLAGTAPRPVPRSGRPASAGAVRLDVVDLPAGNPRVANAALMTFLRRSVRHRHTTVRPS